MSESDLSNPGTKPSPEEEIANIPDSIKTLERVSDVEDDMGYKQRQLRFNKWLTILTGCLVVTSLVAAYISKTAADAAADAISVAQEGLKLNKESVERTLAEMKAQSKAAQTSADATKLQAATNKKALESAIETSRTDQRAWILCTGLKFEKDLKAGELNRFFLSITNAGKTPAQHVRLKCTSRIRTQGKPDIVKTETRYDDLSIGPARGFQFVFDTDPLRISQADVDALQSKTKVLTLFVEISYQDVFKDSHRTGLCLFYDPELKPDFFLCDTGNYVE